MEGKDKKEEFRKPTTEEQKEFNQADKKFDKVMNESRSNIDLRKKTFMKISDVDPEDALWFKSFCDKHTDRKQFLGIKVIRTIVENLEPLVKNVITQLNSHEERLISVEQTVFNKSPPESKVDIPMTQGGNKKKEVGSNV